MKTKEHTRQVRDKVVENFKAGLSYKNISQALNILWSTVQSIIQKWSELVQLVRVDGKMDGAKYRAILEENLFGAAKT